MKIIIILLIVALLTISCALFLIIRSLSIINENLEYILKELYLLIKNK